MRACRRLGLLPTATLRASQVPFTARNYGTETTPRIEWFFIKDPSPDGLVQATTEKLCTYRNVPAGELQAWPSENPVIPAPMSHDKESKRPRAVRTLASMQAELNSKNVQLRANGSEVRTGLGWGSGR